MSYANRAGKCQYMFKDGTRCDADAFIKIPLYDRGGGNACFCERHNPDSYYNFLQEYSDENSAIVGTIKAACNPWSYSIELETSRSNGKSRMELIHNSFIPSSDVTVDIEFKSPIYIGMNAPIKYMDRIQVLIDNGDLEINDNCGTHFHVGYADNSFKYEQEKIRRFYHSLFIPLSNAIEATADRGAKLFGRGIGTVNAYTWANAINEYTDAEEHRNFINTQHDNTLEFRQMKFVNAKQYKNAMHFCRAVSECVISNFCNKFNASEMERGDLSEREWRLMTAKKTGAKLVKIFNKYYEEA